MATGAAKASASLKYKPEMYTPFALETWPDKELRKEYTRLRDIAQKRLKRLSKDPIRGTSDIYKEFSGGFPTLKKNIGTDRKALEQAMADVARFVRSKGSTVGGAKEEFKRRFEPGGINVDEVPKDQYTSLSEWWAIVIASGVYYYPSDQPSIYWREKGGYNVTIDDFVAWQKGEVSYGEEWDYSEGSSSADLRGGFGGGL